MSTLHPHQQQRLEVADVRMTRHLENVRRLTGGSYVRDEPGEFLSGGGGSYLHLEGPSDTTPAHRTYPTGYDSRCGWCYLGGPHSEAAHAAKLAETQPTEFGALPIRALFTFTTAQSSGTVFRKMSGTTYINPAATGTLYTAPELAAVAVA